MNQKIKNILLSATGDRHALPKTEFEKVSGNIVGAFLPDREMDEINPECDLEMEKLIFSLCCRPTNAPEDFMTNRTRQADYVKYRRIVYVGLRVQGFSLHAIGNVCGYKHCNVLAAINKIIGFVEIADPDTMDLIEAGILPAAEEILKLRK